MLVIAALGAQRRLLRPRSAPVPDLDRRPARLRSRRRSLPRRSIRYRRLAPSRRSSDRHCAPRMPASRNAATDKPSRLAISPALVSQVAQQRCPAAASSNALPAGSISNPRARPLAGQLAVGQVIANRSQVGPIPVILLRRAVPAQPILVHSRPFVAVDSAREPQWKTAVAVAKIVDQELQVSRCAKALFFHARRVSPRLAAEAGRVDRQSHLLPLEPPSPLGPSVLASRLALIPLF